MRETRRQAEAGVPKPRSMNSVRHPFAEIVQRLDKATPFELVFESPEVSVELYAPVGADGQTPHDRDELYIVARGTGTFSRADEVVPFQQGDLLFVPAHVPHRFETFTEDFRAWVIFYGDPRSSH